MARENVHPLARSISSVYTVLAENLWRPGDGGVLGYYASIRTRITAVASGDPEEAYPALLSGLYGVSSVEGSPEHLMKALLDLIEGGDALDVIIVLVREAGLPITAAVDIAIAVSNPEVIYPLWSEVLSGARKLYGEDEIVTDTSYYRAVLLSGDWDRVEDAFQPIHDAAGRLSNVARSVMDALRLDYYYLSKYAEVAGLVAVSRDMISPEDVEALDKTVVRAVLNASMIRSTPRDYDP